jgi:hypothetical protein
VKEYSYYDELIVNIKLYNMTHSKRCNKVTIGREAIKHLQNYIVNGKIEGLKIRVDYKVPYIIDVYYSELIDEKNDRIEYEIDKLRCENENLEKVSIKTSNYIDESLRDLKVFIEFGNYLKEIGEDENEI